MKVKNGLIAAVALAVSGFICARLVILLGEGISGRRLV